MSATIEDADALLARRGVSHRLDAWVMGVAFGQEGRTVGFALGDGTVRLADPDDLAAPWREVAAHDGAARAIVPDCADGFLTGGDDGRMARIAPDGSTSQVAALGAHKWVEHLAAHPAGVRAAALGKTVHVFDAHGAVLKTLTHPSSVTGIALDGKGKRLAASHYNGASLWYVGAKLDSPRFLEWKGSHTGVVMHPEGTHVVTSMQEASLHGWRLDDGQHMRMSGYPGKTKSMGFTRSGRWLATAGAESIVLWPFFGGGPMGKPPTELAGGDDVLCTRIACHPQHEVVAAGFGDGLVLLAEVGSGKIVPVAAPGRGAVSALAWSRSGAHLAFGTETGFCGVVNLAKQ